MENSRGELHKKSTFRVLLLPRPSIDNDRRNRIISLILSLIDCSRVIITVSVVYLVKPTDTSNLSSMVLKVKTYSGIPDRSRRHIVDEFFTLCSTFTPVIGSHVVWFHPKFKIGVTETRYSETHSIYWIDSKLKT